MREIQYRDQTVAYDPDATTRFYTHSMKVPGADQCGCLYCKNYAAQRKRLFEPAFVELLARLGIDPLKEWEAYECGPTPAGLRTYGGWFVFVGRILADSKPKAPVGKVPFAFRFTNNFPSGSLPKGTDFCAVEFTIDLPWTLPERPE